MVNLKIAQCAVMVNLKIAQCAVMVHLKLSQCTVTIHFNKLFIIYGQQVSNEDGCDSN